MDNYYLCNYTRGGICCGIGKKLSDIAKHLKYCIDNHGWSLDDHIDIIPEEDALEPGAVFIRGLNVSSATTAVEDYSVHLPVGQ
jgi:hypothetical protein